MSLLTVEIISTTLNFAVVVFILWHFGRKPAAEFFQARSREINDSVGTARKLSSESRRVLQEWDGRLRSAPAEIQTQLEDARQVLGKFRETTLSKAHHEAKRISEEATQMNAAEAVKAKRTLRRQVALESVSQARNYLSQHADKKDTKKLLTEYLERVGNGHAG